MMEKAAFTEDLVAACRDLGRARVVLRNALGLSETFTELSRLELGDGWIHLVQDGAHLHLDVTRLHAVRFHGDAATGESRAIALCGERGCPLLVVVLDQLQGSEAADQAARFESLRASYGPFTRLVSEQQLPGGRCEHRASGTHQDGAAPSVAVAPGLWH
jgi:hypothetical protein